MNGLERYTAVLEGRQPDFLPRLPILMQFAAEWIGSNYGAFASDHRVLVEANAVCATEFGMDQVSCISDPYRETQGFGGTIEYLRDAVPRCTHPLADDRDLALLPRPDPLKAERMLDRVLGARAFHARFAGQLSVLGWVEGPAAEAADLRDTINFLMDLMDDEVYAAELMDRCLDTAIDFARAQIEAGADTIGVGDAIASQVQPDLYDRLILPRERRLVDAIHAAGARVRLHICGDIAHLLPGIATLGVDVLDVDHMVDLAHTRRVVGPRVALSGNINPAAGVKDGTPDSIRAYMRRAYAVAGAPFMVNAGCEIPSGTPPENLRALCEPIAP